MSKQVNSLSDVRFPDTKDQIKRQACGFVHTESVGLCPWNFLMTTPSYLKVATPGHICVAGKRLMLHAVVSVFCQYLAVYSY